jgi:hypothetical protein
MKAKLDYGWDIQTVVDPDGHLNVYITNEDNSRVFEIETGQGGGDGEQMALRFTTQQIEDEHLEELG